MPTVIAMDPFPVDPARGAGLEELRRQRGLATRKAVLAE